MVAYDLRWDAKLSRNVGSERALPACPHGHTAHQAPSWIGCEARGHRRWICRDCHAVTEDPDCPCQGGAGDTWGGQPIAQVIAEISGRTPTAAAGSG